VEQKNLIIFFSMGIKYGYFFEGKDEKKRNSWM
jgi:hypothetical protein